MVEGFTQSSTEVVVEVIEKVWVFVVYPEAVVWNENEPVPGVFQE